MAPATALYAPAAPVGLYGLAAVWVVYALKSYIHRDLMASLEAECRITRVFPGTLGGGEVTVCTASPPN
jgi:hypothetical protein